jgi:hypothetical protein
MNPIKRGKKFASCVDISPDRTSLNILPKIKGTTIKNENRADLSLSIPKSTAVEIVAPERDIPGKIAMACVIPINIDSFTPTFFAEDFALSAKNKSKPVINSILPTAVLLGIDKERSARFSFLMVVPLIFGKMFKDVLSGEISTHDANFFPLLIGFIFAFITGMIACKWMIRLVKNSQLKYFAFYCFIVGSIVIVSSII